MGSRDSKSENSCTFHPEHPGVGSLQHRKGLLFHGQGLCRERWGLGGTLTPPARSQWAREPICPHTGPGCSPSSGRGLVQP